MVNQLYSITDKKTIESHEIQFCSDMFHINAYAFLKILFSKSLSLSFVKPELHSYVSKDTFTLRFYDSKHFQTIIYFWKFYVKIHDWWETHYNVF